MKLFRYVLFAIIGIGVILCNQSVNRATHAGYAADSIFFWPLFPGMFVGYILNSGGHGGVQWMAELVSDLVNTGLYWVVLISLVLTLRKCGALFKKQWEDDRKMVCSQNSLFFSSLDRSASRHVGIAEFPVDDQDLGA